MRPSQLTALQRQVLEAFFRREKRFFLSFGDVRVDPPQGILANKLCALLSRSELRDLIDVQALEEAGFRVEDALPLAEKKDAGLTPAQLAFVLSQIDLTSPPNRRELASYVAALCKRLVAQALPGR